MALWTPAEITGSLWIDPDEAGTLTLNGSNVAQINDKFGGTNYAAQATASYQPALTAYGLNGKSIITFATDKLTLASAIDFRNQLVCLVVRQTTAAVAQMWSHSSINNQFKFDAAATGMSVAGGTAIWGNSISATGAVAFGAWSVIILDGNTTTGKLYVNGALADTGGAQSVAAYFDQLGARATSSEPLIGDIAAALIVSNAVDRQQIEGYLHWRFGLESLLPADHPYKSAAPGITTVPVVAGLEGQYGDVPVLAAGFEGRSSLVMEQAFIGRYGDAAIITAGLIGRHGNAATIQAALVGRYGDMVPVLAALDGRYHLMHSVLAGLVGEHAICGSSVLAALDGRYDLRERNEIMAALVGYYSLLPGATIQQIVCPVRIGGVSVRWSSVSWTKSEDNYLIEATVVLRDPAEFGSIAKLDTVEIDWAGTTYTLFVAAKLRSRSVSGDAGAAEYGADYTIIARSLTAGLDAPYALPVTMSWPATTLASVIAADLIASLPELITLDFRLEDWLQPGGTFFLTDESPLEGLRKLAAIIGGIGQTSPNNALILRMADQTPPAEWETVVPAWTIEDSGLFSDSESESGSNRYNVITVSNQGESDRSTRFEIEDITEYRKRVRGYRVPWADFGLATSGGSWVTIEDGGVVEEPVVDEVVEFVDGSASAPLPVYSMVSVVWLQASLGAITAAEDGSLTSGVMGNSLAKISYTTRCHMWIGTSPHSEEVQFYEVEL